MKRWISCSASDSEVKNLFVLVVGCNTYGLKFIAIRLFNIVGATVKICFQMIQVMKKCTYEYKFHFNII